MLRRVNIYCRMLALLACMSVTGCTTPQAPSPLLETIHRLPNQTIEIDGHHIAYIEKGQGAPLVLLHGFGGSMWQWEYQYSELASSHRVIILDLLGSGMSDKPDVAYTPKLLVRFFTQFLDALSIDQPILIGNSMGAGLAMAMALSVPDRVNALVLISGFPSNPRESLASQQYKQFLYRRPPLWLAKLGNWMGGRWATESILKEIIYNPALITPLVIERSFQNRHRSNFLSPLYSLMDNIDQWSEEFGPRLNQIQQSTLVLWGADDRVFPSMVGQELVNILPNAQFHLINEAGHIPQWEQPTQVNLLITQFLAQQSY